MAEHWENKILKGFSWLRLRESENSIRLRNFNWRYDSAPADTIIPDAQKNVL